MIPPKADSKMVRPIEIEMEKTRMKSIINIFEEKHEIAKNLCAPGKREGGRHPEHQSFQRLAWELLASFLV